MPTRRPNNNFRSGFERSIATNLKRRKVPFKYESVKLEYTTEHIYTPDFELANGILVEAKGYLRPSDRSKMVKVKQQNPDRDIRFLFANAENFIRKGSSTTYGMWATKNGFKWAEGKEVPQEWIDE